MPTLVLSFNINFFPEFLDDPINVKIKILNINCAPTFFYFFHAIQTLTHESKPALVSRVVAFMPRATDVR